MTETFPLMTPLQNYTSMQLTLLVFSILELTRKEIIYSDKSL